MQYVNVVTGCYSSQFCFFFRFTRYFTHLFCVIYLKDKRFMVRKTISKARSYSEIGVILILTFHTHDNFFDSLY